MAPNTGGLTRPGKIHIVRCIPTANSNSSWRPCKCLKIVLFPFLWCSPPFLYSFNVVRTTHRPPGGQRAQKTTTKRIRKSPVTNCDHGETGLQLPKHAICFFLFFLPIQCRLHTLVVHHSCASGSPMSRRAEHAPHLTKIRGIYAHRPAPSRRVSRKWIVRIRIHIYKKRNNTLITAWPPCCRRRDAYLVGDALLSILRIDKRSSRG